MNAEKNGKLSDVVAIPGKRQRVWKLPLKTLEEVDKFNDEINSATGNAEARLIAASDNFFGMNLNMKVEINLWTIYCVTVK